MKKKYLRTKLLYIAGAWMLGIFVVVNIAVHLIVTDYTRRITKKSMDEEFNSRVISEEKEILELRLLMQAMQWETVSKKTRTVYISAP